MQEKIENLLRNLQDAKDDNLILLAKLETCATGPWSSDLDAAPLGKDLVFKGTDINGDVFFSVPPKQTTLHGPLNEFLRENTEYKDIEWAELR